MLSTPTRQQENGKDTTLTTPSPNNIFKEMNLNNLNGLQKNNGINTKRPSKKEIKDAYCCCGSIKLECFVIGITIVELVFYGYQLVTYLFELFFTPVSSTNNIESFPSLDLISEESTSIGLVGLFFILFSIVATILVPIGWYTHSCHLIVPHLIMQFAVLSATLVIMCYIMAWIFGGIDLQINAVFFEHSPLGEEGIRTASQRTPIEANLTITHMQMILAAILFLLAVVFLIELLFFHIMLRVFRYIRDQNGNKLESNNNSFVKVENGIIVGGNVQNDNNLRSPPHNQQQQSPPSLKTCANISSPQLPNTSTTSTTATFSINSSPPPPLVLNETNRILQPTIQIPGNQRHPYNSHSSPAVYYEVQPRKELHV
uniref:Uncharacterized protein n=1 Tax=Meloidogyne incognita TaxID=6306 RepID=A0A914MZN9_MELIC